MPFANERIEENRDQLSTANYRKNEPRSFRFSFNPDKVIENLRSRIIAQDSALSSLEDMLYLLKADFGSPNRPLAVMMLAGPTGVGKTETVRVIAESILGNPDRICRIDMNTLAQEHYSAAITGSPPGYVGSKESQSLFDNEKIKGRFSEPGIVLFDEVEKASQDVVRALMNILDTGKLMLSSGLKELDFRNSIIFMTSNIGAKEISQLAHKYQKGWRRVFGLTPPSHAEILDRALTSHFDPEFINRIDRVLTYDWIKPEQVETLIRLEAGKLNQRLSSCGASLEFDMQAISYLATGYDRRYGARDVIRNIRKELEPKLAKAILKYADRSEFIVTVAHKKLSVMPGNQ